MRVLPVPEAAKFVRGRAVRHVVAFTVLVGWSLICLFPLYWMGIGSIKSIEDVANGPAYVPFINFAPTLDAWRYILFASGDDTLGRFANSAIISSSATAATIFIGGFAAFGLMRTQRSASAEGRLFVAMLASRALPPVITAIPLYVLMGFIGALDSKWGLVAVYTAYNLPIAMWLMRIGFDAVPTEIIDAAVLDGASLPRIFFTMMLPLSASMTVATALLMFILCWNEYTFALVLTQDHALTLPPFLAGQMAVREQMATSQPQWSYFSTLIVIMVAPLLAGTGIVQRLLTRISIRGAKDHP
jgi:multiple sugar transport system permease protein